MLSDIMCKSGERFSWKELKPIFDEKCRVRGVQPDITGLTSDALQEWNKYAWHDRLGPMLKDLPAFDQVWMEWVKTVRELVKIAKSVLDKSAP